MKYLILSLVAVALGSLGCTHAHTICLAVPGDYTPPETTPYTSASDQADYLIGHREGWIREAEGMKTVIDSRTGKIIHSEFEDIPLYAAFTPKSRGYDAGSLKASNQFGNLQTKILNQYKRKDMKPNKSIQATPL